ncbi:hypothetical protein CEUSTIGMA_g8639.t1 [Chlamydomonas eustigma]|uniref:Uncharacterized protein n=1 Tax=Chlamydomonas eustigma TaxID=1157962 RepID=A0A250XDP6_9CHLO|nr:hypothetical protein CEUSTIGMA_g8639.t1 [Chlamydomonas eustigma]|eukprot:GAX81207.1 hypothetical protein CEUSTIGMA_g8639.t1 [Chlamydomonas eustigma]
MAIVQDEYATVAPEEAVPEPYLLLQALQEPPGLDLLVNQPNLFPWATRAENQQGHVAQLKLVGRALYLRQIGNNALEGCNPMPDIPYLGTQGKHLKLPDDLDLTPCFFAPAKIRGAQISPDGDMAGNKPLPLDFAPGLFLLHRKGTRCENSTRGHTFKSTVCQGCPTRRVDWYFLGVKMDYESATSVHADGNDEHCSLQGPSALTTSSCPTTSSAAQDHHHLDMMPASLPSHAFPTSCIKFANGDIFAKHISSLISTYLEAADEQKALQQTPLVGPNHCLLLDRHAHFHNRHQTSCGCTDGTVEMLQQQQLTSRYKWRDHSVYCCSREFAYWEVSAVRQPAVSCSTTAPCNDYNQQLNFWPTEYTAMNKLPKKTVNRGISPPPRVPLPQLPPGLIPAMMPPAHLLPSKTMHATSAHIMRSPTEEILITSCRHGFKRKSITTTATMQYAASGTTKVLPEVRRQQPLISADFNSQNVLHADQGGPQQVVVTSQLSAIMYHDDEAPATGYS